MGGLLMLEQRLERLVNGLFARAFRSEVQPVEITAALRRECDTQARRWPDGRAVVPGRFVVELGPHEHARFAPYRAELVGSLTEALRAYAQAQRFHFAGPLGIDLQRAQDLPVGRVRIHAAALLDTARLSAPTESTALVVHQTHTAQKPTRAETRCWLEIDGRRIHLAGRPVVLGRGAESDVVVDDPGVSRRHARLHPGPGARVTDLGSTNGIRVDGLTTSDAALHDGSRLQLGATTVVHRCVDG